MGTDKQQEGQVPRTMLWPLGSRGTSWALTSSKRGRCRAQGYGHCKADDIMGTDKQQEGQEEP